MGQDVGGFGGRAVVRAAAGEPGCALARGGAGRRRRLGSASKRSASKRSPITPGNPAYEAVRTEDGLYVEYETGERELYDPGIDPHQLDNLTGTRPEEEANLCARLQALKVGVGNGCKSAEGP